MQHPQAQDFVVVAHQDVPDSLGLKRLKFGYRRRTIVGDMRIDFRMRDDVADQVVVARTLEGDQIKPV